MAYCSLADLRQYLDLGDEPGQDALLVRFIEEAQSIVESATGKTFEARADTTRALHAVDDVDGSVLYLRGKLAVLTSVVNGNGVSVSGSAYVALPRGGPFTQLILKASSGLTWRYTTDPAGAISVTGRWADTATPPADIRAATRVIAAWLYRRRDQGPDFDNASVSTTAGVVLTPPSLPREARVILDRYTDRPGAGARVVRGRLVYG
jgi:hypothetical protein